MAGFHYRFSVNVGARMGNEVAAKIVDAQLRRRDRRTTPRDVSLHQGARIHQDS
jgi:hypothetical protein